ncbi:tyrosine-type recombinase/integrase [Brevibacillus invocatus]|uniref:tyrosine-type recombinase/integrase n=1 Tax=Brevibacillus invocatus TaxID=173959 RepID=UPI002041CF7C|nr:tyrosine-type recombinase/integrase [Brevibacillus invocatus]EAO9488579.1 helix-turn-helix domain-containing protein [Salmonella enterica]MCM3082036.1 tyrosine-type recombinase/integrase [Brevibacillus invocatus]MCM3432447.1 tyrosine-type recombinase/integrase [Brevibacillus invocatus]
MKNMEAIGESIRLHRLKNGMSQEQLALSAGVNTSYIGQIERGENNPTIRILTTQMIEKFYSYLAQNCGLSESSILYIHKILKCSFKTGVKRKYISHNPVADAESPNLSRKEMQAWNLDQAVSFLKMAEESDLSIAFLLAVTTGMRQGEILGLRWKDIDFEEGVLYVRQTLSHDGKHLNQETKTKASARTISLTDKTVTELSKLKKRRAKEKLAAGKDYLDLNFVVCTKSGTPVHPRNLLRVFYNLLKKAKVPAIRFHDIRHTVATLMLQKSINPKIVKEIIGHSDIRVTFDTYSHVLPSVHKETAKQFGDMLFG